MKKKWHQTLRQPTRTHADGIRAAARELGVDAGTLRAWRSAGLWSTDAAGRVDLRAVHRIAEHKRDIAQAADGACERVALALACRAELEASAARGELIPAAHVREVWRDAVGSALVALSSVQPDMDLSTVARILNAQAGKFDFTREQ